MFYLLDNKQKVINTIPDSEVAQATKKEELKGTTTAEITFKRNVYKKLDSNACYIAFLDENVTYSSKIQVFKILNNGLKEKSRILAINIFFDDLKHKGYVRDKRIKSLPLSTALNTVVIPCGWEYETHVSASGSANWYDKDYLECFKDILNNWNVEFDLEIEMKDNQITKKKVHLYDKIGVDTGKRVVYSHNTVDMEITETKGDIFTALSGRGKGEEKFNEEGESTGGYGRKIQFTDVEWSKSKGDPLDKPRGQNYLEDKEATKLYGFKDGTARLGIVEFSDCESPEELLKLTYQALLTSNRPRVQIKTSMQLLGNLYLGDYVNIIRKDIGISFKARAISIERNLLNGKLSDVILGDHFFTSAEKQRLELKAKFDRMQDSLANFSDKVVSELEETEKNVLGDLQDALTQMMYDDDSFNYTLAKGNKYNLPSGFYMFNSPIDKNPTKAMYIGGGKFSISNKKDSQGKWIWSTFGTGDGFVADNIVAGSLKGGRMDFNLTNGTFKIGSTLSNYPILDYDGETLRLGRNSAKEIKVERNGDVKLPKVGETDIENYAITETKISSGAITTPKIASNSIGTNELKANSVTANEIASNTITAQNIKTGAITTDFLYPGSSERIILERGYPPGANDCKSIDAGGNAIRLKINSGTYLRMDKSGSVGMYSNGRQFFVFNPYESWEVIQGNGSYAGGDGLLNAYTARILCGWLDSYGTGIRSDKNLKKDIEYLDEGKRKEVSDFIKEIDIASYKYKENNIENISIIAQDVAKNKEIAKYILTKDNKGYSVSLYPYISTIHIALQEEIKKRELLEAKAEKLESRLKKLEEALIK